MAQDFDKLVKVAQAAIEQCKAQQAEIATMKSSMSKKASTVDAQLVEKSVNALIKMGGLNQEQAQETKQLLSTDPNASLRALLAVCKGTTDAKNIVKTQSVNLDGGILISQNKQVKNTLDNQTEAYSNVAKVLGLNMN